MARFQGLAGEYERPENPQSVAAFVELCATELLLPAGFLDSNLLPHGRLLALRWLCNRKDLAHVFGEPLAKALGIRQEWAPLVPLNDQSLPKRFTPVCYAQNS
jgi:hypothetical protein